MSDATVSGPRWDREDLIRHVLLALRLVDRAVRVSVQDAQTRTAAQRLPVGICSDIHPLVPAKVVGEATLLLRSVAGPADHDHRIAAAADQLARLVAPIARSEDVRAAICLDPARALEHGFAHVLLTDAGYPDADFERLLAQSSDAPHGMERLPTRELEQNWLAGIRAGVAGSDDDTLARSVLGRALDALAASAHDHYSFTHAVLYASDVGRRVTNLPRTDAEISADADTALAAALDADNADLCAGLLWTWPMLGLPWTPTATFAFTVLAARQDEHGFLPGPAYRASDDLHRLPVELHEEYVLRSSYHTTLVMGMLCASALARTRRPPPALDCPGEPGGSADVIYALLRDRSRPWQRAFEGLESGQQDGLTALLVAVALRRARSATDLGLVRETLILALRHGCVDAPAPRQAVGLLRRTSLATRLASATPPLELVDCRVLARNV